MVPLSRNVFSHMKDNSQMPLLPLLQGTACVVIILWGARLLSDLLGPLLLGLLLAYAVAPFPKWLMHRFKLSKARATGLTAVVLSATGLLVVSALELGVAGLTTRLPIYGQRLAGLYEQVTVFLSAHGVEPTSLAVKNVLTPERLSEITVFLVPAAGAIFAKGALILLVAFLLIVEMLHGTEGKPGPLGEILTKHGFHSRRYVAVTAKTAGINALLNLVFLLAMGVDGAVLWVFLYFFLDFIPTLGFSIALIPPTFITLLMQGWKRALLVGCGLILTNLIVDNIIMPMFAKHELSISFLEITLSLVGWAFLFGLPGAVMAIPMTLALKELIAKNSAQRALAKEAAG